MFFIIVKGGDKLSPPFDNGAFLLQRKIIFLDCF